MSALRLAAVLLIALALGVGAYLFLGSGSGAQAPQRERGASPAMARTPSSEVPVEVDEAGAAARPAAGREAIAAGPERAALPVPQESATGDSEAPVREAFVRGRLRSESGEWKDLGTLLAGGVVVDLVSEQDARVKRRAQLSPEQEPDGRVALAFAIENLAPGPYLLTVSSLEPEVWSPDSLHLEAPYEGLEIWCRDRVDRVRLEFRVLDDQSGEVLEGWSASSLRQTVSQSEGVLLHAGPLALDSFPVDGAVVWSLWAPGYAPAFGDERDFAPGEQGVWTAEVRLRTGWGARVLALARDPGMRPIAGALVYVDGEFAGETGPLGWLDLQLAERPQRVEAGWGERFGRVEEPPGVASAQARSRGQQVVVVMAPRAPPDPTPEGEN